MTVCELQIVAEGFAEKCEPQLQGLKPLKLRRGLCRS
jgi:hypothetical protein